MWTAPHGHVFTASVLYTSYQSRCISLFNSSPPSLPAFSFPANHQPQQPSPNALTPCASTLCKSVETWAGGGALWHGLARQGQSWQPGGAVLLQAAVLTSQVRCRATEASGGTAPQPHHREAVGYAPLNSKGRPCRPAWRRCRRRGALHLQAAMAPAFCQPPHDAEDPHAAQLHAAPGRGRQPGAVGAVCRQDSWSARRCGEAPGAKGARLEGEPALERSCSPSAASWPARAAWGAFEECRRQLIARPLHPWHPAATRRQPPPPCRHPPTLAHLLPARRTRRTSWATW